MRAASGVATKCDGSDRDSTSRQGEQSSSTGEEGAWVVEKVRVDAGMGTMAGTAAKAVVEAGVVGAEGTEDGVEGAKSDGTVEESSIARMIPLVPEETDPFSLTPFRSIE